MLNNDNVIKKNNLTLIVDGNWLWMSRLSVLNSKYNNVIELCNDLKLMITKSINIVLRQFPEIDNIIFVTDGGSWRSQVPIPEFMQKKGEENKMIIEYKGTRVTNDLIDWDVVWENYAELVTILENCGITVCRENGLEGDDWIYYWTKYLNENNINTIIWTKDNDLKQLVKFNKDKCFTIWWNKDSGVYSAEYDDSDNNMDFFFNTEYNKNEEIFNNVVKHAKEITQIDPYKIIVDKILKGDGSDNILPVIVRKAKTNSQKKFKISTKDIDYSINIDDLNNVKEYFQNLLVQKSYIGRVEDTLDQIMEHFEYNKKLVVLKEESYPEEILEIFNKYKTFTISTNISEVESKLQAKSNKLNGILDII